eukprot:Clim_evm76s215 gene=Clim_evmTU76s215
MIGITAVVGAACLTVGLMARSSSAQSVASPPSQLGCAVIGETLAGLDVFQGTGMPLDYYNTLNGASLEENGQGLYNCLITVGSVSVDDEGTLQTYIDEYGARWLALNWAGPAESARTPTAQQTLRVIPAFTGFADSIVKRDVEWDATGLIFDVVPNPQTLGDFDTLVSTGSDATMAVVYQDAVQSRLYVLSDLQTDDPNTDGHFMAGLALQHLVLQWVTRGFFVGTRQMHVCPQVDDFFLATNDKGRNLVPPEDVSWHIDWTNDFNSVTGNNMKIDLAFNGMGLKGQGKTIFNEWGNYNTRGIHVDDYRAKGDNPDQYTDPWPDQWWNDSTFYQQWFDEFPLARAAQSEEWNDGFYWMSHTMTHANLAALSTGDMVIELEYSIHIAEDLLGLKGRPTWSRNGFIAGTYSGMQSAATFEAMKLLGMTSSLTDNGNGGHDYTIPTRDRYLPWITTVATNGEDGILLVPRFRTRIAWNAAEPAENVAAWNAEGYTFTDMEDLLRNDTIRLGSQLMRLRQDPWMYHQANMNRIDYAGEETSLLTLHIRRVVEGVQEFLNLPVSSLKHDDIAEIFRQRLALSNCNAEVTVQRTTAGEVNYVKVMASDGDCQVPLEGIILPEGANDESDNAVLFNDGDRALIMAVQGQTYEFGEVLEVDDTSSSVTSSTTTSTSTTDPMPTSTDEEIPSPTNTETGSDDGEVGDGTTDGSDGASGMVASFWLIMASLAVVTVM